jgi:hypothetical protein
MSKKQNPTRNDAIVEKYKIKIKDSKSKIGYS